MFFRQGDGGYVFRINGGRFQEENECCVLHPRDLQDALRIIEDFSR